MRTLQVALGARSYPIHIGQNLLGTFPLADYVRGNQVMVITNERVAPLYLDAVLASFGNLQCDTLVLPDGEQFKTLETLEKIFDALMLKRHSRTTTLVALGGGVIGDMVGFAAACFQRGVDFIQIPTTLLAQVDSSVGGKTAVNHPRGKNMIGAFHQPQLVLIDTDVLSTLPDRELAAGYAEVVKYGLIRDAEFYHWLEQHNDALRQRDPALMEEAIYRSCLNKAQVVADDETEQGNRAILNLGHTFGHAIETATGYGNWLHGEAVAVGMLMAVALSEQQGWLANDVQQSLASLLLPWGLPVQVPAAMTPDIFMDLMLLDKKVQNGQLRLVLMSALGHAIVTSDYNPESLQQVLDMFCSGRQHPGQAKV